MTLNELLYSLQTKNALTRALLGAAIALVVVTVFLVIIFFTGEIMPGKSFGQILWELLPVLTTMVGGAAGGIFYFLLMHVLKPKGRLKILTIIFSVVVYAVILWLSLVAGLSVTGHWD